MCYSICIIFSQWHSNKWNALWFPALPLFDLRIKFQHKCGMIQSTKRLFWFGPFPPSTVRTCVCKGKECYLATQSGCFGWSECTVVIIITVIMVIMITIIIVVVVFKTSLQSNIRPFKTCCQRLNSLENLPIQLIYQFRLGARAYPHTWSHTK